jgi:signal transduction histidine kinase
MSAGAGGGPAAAPAPAAALARLAERVAGAGDDPELALAAIAEAAGAVGEAEAALVYLWEPERGHLRLGAAAGRAEEPRRRALAERAAAAALASAGVTIGDAGGRPAVPPEREPGNGRPPGPPGGAVAWARLLRAGGQVVGALVLLGAAEPPAAAGSLLDLLAAQAALAADRARLIGETFRLRGMYEEKCREFSVLLDIGDALRGTLQIERLAAILLTGITHGEGLAYNRAILFLVQDRGTHLQGVMGVGPDSAEEAGEIWEQLAARPRPLAALLREVAAHGIGRPASRFDALARQLRVPLAPGAGVVALAALERAPVRVEAAATDPRVHPEGEGRLGVERFAAVPLLAKERVAGVVLVDNKFTGRPITDRDLELLGVFANQAGLALGHAHVVGHLESASRELQRSHHELMQLEKLAVLGEMAANVVHEIRNPLVAIGGFARRLERRAAERSDEERYARIILTEVARLERIVQDVLGLAKDPKAEREAARLEEIVEDCLRLLEQRLAEQAIALDLRVGARAAPVHAHVAQMKQAILNVLNNAIEAMPHGGTLGVRLEPEAEEVSLRVQDSGPGIPEEQRGRVFQPFFTTKERGTGLGLTLVQKILRAHGGAVEVGEAPGGGAEVCLRLPLAGPPGPGAA